MRFQPLATRQNRGCATQGRSAGMVTKSNLILGMGEEPDEVVAALHDLHDAGCDLVTITQYLRPTPRHHPVERWVHPDEFAALAAEAEGIGFAGVMSTTSAVSVRGARSRVLTMSKRLRVADPAMFSSIQSPGAESWIRPLSRSVSITFCPSISNSVRSTAEGRPR